VIPNQETIKKLLDDYDSINCDLGCCGCLFQIAPRLPDDRANLPWCLIDTFIADYQEWSDKEHNKKNKK